MGKVYVGVTKISLEEINLLTDALEEFKDNEMDREILREEIYRKEVDWDYAASICLKYKRVSEAFELLKKLKERINDGKEYSEWKKEIERGTNSV